MNPIPSYYETHELTHTYSGNGFYFLDAVQPGYVRVVKLGRDGKILPKVATAAQDHLCMTEFDLVDKDTGKRTHVQREIPEDGIAKIQQLRGDLASGKKVVKNGFILNA